MFKNNEGHVEFDWESKVKRCRIQCISWLLFRDLTMEISRKDWKLFREKLPVWQENCMSLLIKGYITLLTTEDKRASERFWELERKIKIDRCNPGVILNMRKSEAVYDIISLIRLGVITYDDLADFSEDVKKAVKLILNRQILIK